MLKSKRFWIWMSIGLISVAVAWTAWQAVQVNRDLNSAVDHAERIQDAVEERDTAALEREFSALRKASSSASERTNGFTWSALTHLPMFGDDADGIRTTSRVLADLAKNGVEPLVTVSNRFEELLPKDGKIDVALAEDMTAPVAQAREAFATADIELAAVDRSGFIGRLDKQFRSFRDQVDRAADVLGSAEIATKVLPTMLGADGPRHYLIAFENNAELRGMGGMVGAASYVDVVDGKLDLSEHVSGGSLGVAPEPVLPLTAAEKKLYGDVFGTYFVNATHTLDAPRAADLLRARWLTQHPDRKVDGVIFVDAVAMGYLLDATGPLTVDGVEVTGANAVDQLLNGTYLRLANPADQDKFFADVAGATFDRFTSGLSHPTAALKALGRAVDERRVAVHSFEPGVQEELSGTRIAAEFPGRTADAEPTIALTVSDMTGSKMSYYLRYDVEVTPTTCQGSKQGYTAKARFTSTAPADAASLPDSITGGGNHGTAPGNQFIGIRIFGAAGGSISGMELNGVTSATVDVDDDGRPVAMTYLELKPGQTVDLAWKMATGANQSGDTTLVVTPTIEGKDSTRTLPSACAGER